MLNRQIRIYCCWPGALNQKQRSNRLSSKLAVASLWHNTNFRFCIEIFSGKVYHHVFKVGGYLDDGGNTKQPSILCPELYLDLLCNQRHTLTSLHVHCMKSQLVILSLHCFHVFREVPVNPKICFVKFSETETVGVSLHLNSTVFIDRALLITPVMDGKLQNSKLFNWIRYLNVDIAVARLRQAPVAFCFQQV